MSRAFSAAVLAEIEAMRPLYPDPQALILPVLHLAQKEFGGSLDETSILLVAKTLGFPPSLVEGVATFYTMYNRKAVGRYHVQICRNLACSLLGAEHLISAVSKHLGIRPGQTTPDGKFTLSLVECLAACGTAPVMMVNDDIHEGVTEAQVKTLLDGLP